MLYFPDNDERIIKYFPDNDERIFKYFPDNDKRLVKYFPDKMCIINSAPVFRHLASGINKTCTSHNKSGTNKKLHHFE